MKKYGFLEKKVLSYGVVLIDVVDSPRPQVLKARVEKVYSARHGVEHGFLSREIEFVCSPGTWGNVSLVVGERAILFISKTHNVLYENSWRGHMVVEEIDAVQYAIFPHKELWLSEEVPLEIRSGARQDPNRSYATAICLDVVECYLLKLIGRAEIK